MTVVNFFGKNRDVIAAGLYYTLRNTGIHCGYIHDMVDGQQEKLRQLSIHSQLIICDSPMILSLSSNNKYHNINFVVASRYPDTKLLRALQKANIKYTVIDGLDIAKLYLELHCGSEIRRNKE